MAYKKLQPYREEIIKLRSTPNDPNRMTFVQLAEHLFKAYELETSPGTLCKFYHEIAGTDDLRDACPDEALQIEAAALLAEVLAEIQKRGNEQRSAIEKLSGHIRINTETLEELTSAMQKAPAPQKVATDIPIEMLRKIWLRAFLICGAVWVALAGVIYAFT